ncbi:hypothetical protein ATZ36_10990 [Candidatus Endomicrobiellum trichonymphae]|jgi:hypothetical protein|uniref:Uncharacterized protein n=1 Tax=Endomicrobium trichonymphae TaxID=1408204 RepID=A0A1E5IFN0_ENDTX|nr:hypothetical protein ATZ36_10990 [Candidatus Endomicrobium trichonymphae]
MHSEKWHNKKMSFCSVKFRALFGFCRILNRRFQIVQIQIKFRVANCKTISARKTVSDFQDYHTSRLEL